MTNRTRNLLLFVVLAGAALGTWLLAREPEAVRESRVDSTPVSRSFYMVDAELYATDDAGRIRYTIEAEYVEQAEAADELLFEGISVRYAPEAEIDWRISAARGFASGDPVQLRLTDGLRLVQSGSNDEEEKIVETNEAMLFADEFRVEAEQPVTILQPGFRMTGTGLVIDLQSDSGRLYDAIIVNVP